MFVHGQGREWIVFVDFSIIGFWSRLEVEIEIERWEIV
jgi:hypothetical protein